MTARLEAKANLPADVPASKRADYLHNWEVVTKGTGRLMLLAGDQKVEHLNDDFVGDSAEGPIATDDADPEHLFRIAAQGTIGCFATQFGLIARYGLDYGAVPYLVKINSKTHLVKTSQRDPRSLAWVTMEDVLRLREAGLKIVGVGFTVYPGSEFEAEQIREAARVCLDAHQQGLIAVVWIYPRGVAVVKEQDPHLLAGAAGLGAALGADFCKVNFAKPEDGRSAAESFKEAVRAAGRTRVITAGGGSTDVATFLQTLHDQIFISGASGSATGRNIHQKDLESAIRMTKAISSITYGGFNVDAAMAVFEGGLEYSI